jgi:hypothetical protein
VRLRTARPFPTLEVRNPLHETRYLVMLPEFPRRDSALCTCADFARRGLGTCKHIEAAVPWLAEHPDATPLIADRPRSLPGITVWKRVDSRLAALPRERTPTALRWRRPGAVLYEGAPER